MTGPMLAAVEPPAEELERLSTPAFLAVWAACIAFCVAVWAGVVWGAVEVLRWL